MQKEIYIENFCEIGGNKLNQERNIKRTMKNILKNICIPLVLVSSIFIMVCLIDFDYEKYTEDISDIFSKLSNFFSVMIGVYIAILVFLSTSRTPISGLLFNKRLDRSFSKITKSSIIYGVGFVLFNAVSFCYCDIIIAILICLALMELFYMIYFFMIVFKTFDYNMLELEKDNENQNRKTESFITLIEQIENNTRK